MVARGVAGSRPEAGVKPARPRSAIPAHGRETGARPGPAAGVGATSGADETGDGLGGFGDLEVGGLAPGLRGVDDAVAEVVVEQPERDALEGLGEGRDLREDVDAVLLLVDHAVDAAGLALDALEARQVAVLVADVAVRRGQLRRGGCYVHRFVLVFWWCGSRAGGRQSPAVLVNVRSRKLLPTTKTLENAMAAPASIGLSRPDAASGIAATL